MESLFHLYVPCYKLMIPNVVTSAHCAIKPPEDITDIEHLSFCTTLFTFIVFSYLMIS